MKLLPLSQVPQSSLPAFLEASHCPILGAPGHQAHQNASRDTYRRIRIVEKGIRALPHNSITPSIEFTGAATRSGAGIFVDATASTLIAFHSAVGRDAHGELVHFPCDVIVASAAHKHAFFISHGKVARVILVTGRLVASHVEKEGFVAANKVARWTNTTSDALTTAIAWARTFGAITETGFIPITETDKFPIRE
jgi:hypothetical protein